MGKPAPRNSSSRRGRPKPWSHGIKRTFSTPGANPVPPGLRGIHRLANRVLLASLLLSTVLCVLELQVRLMLRRTYTALQEDRTMQQLYLDSRSQLVATLGTVDSAGTTAPGGGLTDQGPEPLVLPPPPSRLPRRHQLLVRPGRWLNAGAVLRGY